LSIRFPPHIHPCADPVSAFFGDLFLFQALCQFEMLIHDPEEFFDCLVRFKRANKAGFSKKKIEMVDI
jgi:hypothetical protein